MNSAAPLALSNLAAACAFCGSIAFLTALLATPITRKLARRWKILDFADGQRKLHQSPIPLLGGLAVVAALSAGLAASVAAFRSGLPELHRLCGGVLASVWLAAAVGCCDDVRGLRVRWKLLGQVLAALPAALAGLAVERLQLAGVVIELGWLAMPFTIGLLVAAMNAMNFLDGADGLAAGIGCTLSGGIACLALNGGSGPVAISGAALAGSLAGFLVYNRSPATIFLGDAGSLSIGMVLGALACAAARTPAGNCQAAVLLALLGLPMADIGLAIVRRTFSGGCFWVADRRHIHHCLLDGGFTVGGMVCCLCGLSMLLAVVAFLTRSLDNEAIAWGAFVLVGVGVVRLRWFGRREWVLGKSLVRRLILRRLSRERAYVVELEPTVWSVDGAVPQSDPAAAEGRQRAA